MPRPASTSDCLGSATNAPFGVGEAPCALTPSGTGTFELLNGATDHEKRQANTAGGQSALPYV